MASVSLKEPEMDILDEIDEESLTKESQRFRAIEKRVLRKFDLIVLPCIALCYLYSNLDKSNIGNANAAGMSSDLGLTEQQYGNIVSLLFVTYVVFEVPFALLLKYVGCKKLLTVLVFFFGVISLCTSFVQSYGSLLACRILLGLAESGIIPIINVYLGMVYTKSEMAKRCSSVYSASALAGAFGGLLAYGLIRIQGWDGWRWLFAIEGALTICACPILLVLLPNELTTVWWLTEEERHVLRIRLETYPDFFYDEKFSWGEVIRAFKDINNIIICCYEFCVDYTLFGISTFLPSIIKAMGYDKYETQLLTIPVYAVAFFSFVGVGFFSDKWKHRGGFLIGGALFELVGYVVLITTTPPGPRYVGCMLIGVGMYVCSALSILWANNNNAGHYKRATMGGMITGSGSLSGVLIGQVYKGTFHKGFKIGLGLSCAAIPLVAWVMFNYRRVNKKREAQGQDLMIKAKDDRDVNFRFIL
jgi:MFS family permease